MHHRALSAFSEGIRLQHGDIIGKWEQQVLDWEMDNNKFCPYNLPDESTWSYNQIDLYSMTAVISLEVTLAMVKKQISDEELVRVARGEREYTSGELSACDFIVWGIDIQDQQCASPP